MVYPTPPHTFRCRECGWQTSVTPRIGDARLPGQDHSSECPLCGKQDITRQAASTLEIAGARLHQLLRQR